MSYPVTQVLCHRSILIIDAEGSTRLTDPNKACLRTSMYELLEQALDAGGFTGDCRHPYMDRGDGVLTLIRPLDEAPKTALLGTVVPKLATLLAEHNARDPDRAFRLRAVVHAGEVTFDPNGCFGEALDVAFRLLEARSVKDALTATDAPMVLVVSGDVYRCVVRHRYAGIDPDAFQRIPPLDVLGLPREGWVREVGVLGVRPVAPVTRMTDYLRRA